jgi:hypothetical protein
LEYEVLRDVVHRYKLAHIHIRIPLNNRILTLQHIPRKPNQLLPVIMKLILKIPNQNRTQIHQLYIDNLINLLLFLLRPNQLHNRDLQLFVDNRFALSEFEGLVHKGDDHVFDDGDLGVGGDVGVVEELGYEHFHDFALVVGRVEECDFFL